MAPPRIGYGYAARWTSMEVMRRLYLEDALSLSAIESQLEFIRGKKSKSHMATVLHRMWTHPILTHPLGSQMVADGRQQPFLYWGLLTATYPFVRQVSQHLGVGLGLADQVTTRQLISRVIRQVGHTRRVEVGVQAVLTTLVDWGFLQRTRPGVYQPAPKITLPNKLTGHWLALASLWDSPYERMALATLEQLAWWFPFEVRLSRSWFFDSPWFVAEQQAMTETVVGLRSEKSGPCRGRG